MAREEQEIRYPDYPLFKGLQKPLEFMGIQGRYIYWAAATAGGAIIGFIAAYCLMGIIAGLIGLVGAMVCIKHIVGKFRILPVHKITMKANQTKC